MPLAIGGGGSVFVLSLPPSIHSSEKVWFVGFKWNYNCNEKMNRLHFGIDPNRVKGTARYNVCHSLSSITSFQSEEYFKGIQISYMKD